MRGSLIRKVSKCFGRQDGAKKHCRSKINRSIKNSGTHSQKMVSALLIDISSPLMGNVVAHPPNALQHSPLPDEANDSDPGFDVELDFGIDEVFDVISMNMPTPLSPHLSIKFRPFYSWFGSPASSTSAPFQA